MKLTIFQSDKGDCLLLRSADDKRILIDGGMRTSYKKYVRPEIGRLREENKKIDLVYVSHIDSDHISGILQLMDDEVDWRVYNYHHNNPDGNKKWKVPKFKRPAQILSIWHNAFHDQIKDNAGQIEELLAASSGLFSLGQNKKFLPLAEQYNNLVTSKSEAIQLSQRINAEQLNIPLNRNFDGKLALVRSDKDPIKIGKLDIYVIGPSGEDLKELRREWDKWLTNNKETVKRLREKANEMDDISVENILNELSTEGLNTAGKLGDRNRVTPANLASLMLLVEENGKTILLTGDGHSKDILKGLKHYKKLNDNGGMHVNVLKVQHHGSEYNIDPDFAKKITADNYIFCGNGAHENPDLDVLDLIIKSRTGTAAQKSKNVEVNNPFRFIFNSTSTFPDGKPENISHMKDVEDKMKTYKKHSSGKLDYKFFKDAKYELDV